MWRVSGGGRPASALAAPSAVDSLTGPAHIDGHTFSAAQMKHRYRGQKLFFVLGSREEGRNLAGNCLSGWPFGCFTTWDDLNSSGGWTFIAANDSVELWHWFNDVTSSVWVP